MVDNPYKKGMLISRISAWNTGRLAFPAKSVILFYSEVFFSQPSFSEFLIFELYKKLLKIIFCLPMETIKNRKPHSYWSILIHT